jgi:signal transduction histidine kinase/CheY-like chemotaxis protein
MGGRYILIHMIRQAEQDIQTVGFDIKTLIVGELQRLQTSASDTAAALARTDAERSHDFLQEQLEPFAGQTPIHLAAFLKADGTFDKGCWLIPGAPLAMIEATQVSLYFSDLSPLSHSLLEAKTATGLISFEGKPVFIAVAPITKEDDTVPGFVVLGSLFYNNPLLVRINDATSGMQISVSDHRSGRGKNLLAKTLKNAGVTPAVQDVFNFYSGGRWHLGENTFEAILPIHDMLGREVSSISIRLPHTFSSLASIALGWLTAFVSTVGIIFILPIFWFQTRLVLNPLSSLAKQIREIGLHHQDGNYSYLQWSENDEFGLVAQSVNTLLDTLSQKTQQITQIEQRQRALIAGMPDGLCVFDTNSHLVAIHKQPDYAHPVPGLISGRPISPPLFPESDCEALRKAIEKTFQTETIQMVIISCRETDGSYRHFETRISRMDPFFVLVILRDVTQEWRERETRQQMEGRLAKIEKMESLGNLAAGIAHDFNNILSIIRNTVDTTWSAPMEENDSEVELAIGTIREAASKGTALTRELMTYAGHTHIAFKRQDPNTLILDVEKLMGRVIASNVVLEFKLTPDLPWVDADPHQFWKVLINILKNASEAMNGSRGHICLSTYPFEMTEENLGAFFSTHQLIPSPGIVFAVDDTGSGIPHELIDRLFEPFFSTKAVGRGLGLATVFGIVDAHNGGIAIDSEPGKGTSFRVWLPAAKETLQPPPPAIEPNPPPAPPPQEKVLVLEPDIVPEPSGNGSCVLIVEDDPAILKTTGMLLHSLGATTLQASTKREALAVFRKHADEIALILLDAQTGSLDNVRLLSALRTRKPGIPTVIVSGHSESRIRELFASEPFNGFLCKPYTISELKAIIAPFMIRRP